MSETYRQTEQVIVFLGVGHDCSQFFDFCERISFRGESTIDDYFIKMDSVSVLTQMMCLFDRPWWSRAWIVQELAYARNGPKIMYEDRSVPSATFHEAFELFYERAQSILTRAL